MSFVQKKETRSYQYVHWSGSVFVRIVDEPVKSDTLSSPNARKINFEESDEHESSSYEDSSERVHLKVNSVLNDLINDFDNEKFPTGFFWSLNFSLSKKWRSSYNGMFLIISIQTTSHFIYFHTFNSRQLILSVFSLIKIEKWLFI